MTDLHLPRLDLARAVTEALGRGRYVLMTDGGGAPLEITLDLKERDDDGFEDEPQDWVETSSPGRLNAAPRREDIGKWRPFDVALDGAGTDDHGPSVPAQGAHEVSYASPFVSGPRVYEFAMQDVGQGFLHIAFDAEETWLERAPDQEAVAAADWVHVYDRVTRERRTLKRPAPDAVLTGLRDVAADLRGKTYPEKAAAHLKGLPVEPPFGCAALPPVGPLTSTEGLRAGDVLRVIWAAKHGGMGTWQDGDIVTVVEAYGRGRDLGGEAGAVVAKKDGEDHQYHADRFAFVGRPDADGWMTWAGGENPVPGATVDYQMTASGTFRDRSDVLRWSHDPGDYAGANIVAFRIVDTPSAV